MTSILTPYGCRRVTTGAGEHGPELSDSQNFNSMPVPPLNLLKVPGILLPCPLAGPLPPCAASFYALQGPGIMDLDCAEKLQARHLPSGHGRCHIRGPSQQMQSPDQERVANIIATATCCASMQQPLPGEHSASRANMRLRKLLLGQRCCLFSGGSACDTGGASAAPQGAQVRERSVESLVACILD